MSSQNPKPHPANPGSDSQSSQTTPSLPRNRLSPEILLKALSGLPHFVQTETADYETGFQLPAAMQRGQAAFQVTSITIDGKEVDLEESLPDAFIISDFDQPQQDELAEDLEAALIGQGTTWQLDNLILHEGCAILEFLRIGAEIPESATPENSADLSLAMVSPLLDHYRIIFQTSPDTGVAVDLKENHGTTIMAATAVLRGIIVSHSINVYRSGPETLWHRWTVETAS